MGFVVKNILFRESYYEMVCVWRYIYLMDRETLQHRCRKFHIDVINVCRELPQDPAGSETAKQIIRSAGSMSANYSSSLRAKSRRDFIHKLKIVLEEADESLYWLTVIKDARLSSAERVDPLLKEANELTAIFASSLKTALKNLKSNAVRS